MKPTVIEILILFATFASVNSEISSNSIELTDGIDYSDFVWNYAAYKERLSQEGFWIYWDISLRRVPYNAVHAGYDKFGPCFVIRADHKEKNGVFIGKIIGKYFPMKHKAVIGYDGKEHAKENFELLLHTNFAWTSKIDPRPEIYSGTAKICRSLMSNEFFVPGNLVFEKGVSKCFISYDGKEMSFDLYQVLRRNCVDMS